MPDVTIRPLASPEEYSACVKLQHETWGAAFREAVPPSLMLVAQKMGGVAAGAFGRDNSLLGFVYGMSGVWNGEIAHWSDMLAVREEARNRGIARRLKEYQRATVAKIGARAILWSYDPLVARNAHLNFNVFGVHVEEYVPDMYGAGTGSRLHEGVGTDRLVVAWPVNDADLTRLRTAVSAARADQAFADAPVLGEIGESPGQAADVFSRARVRIAVPHDFESLLDSAPDRAAGWRGENRAAFQAAFAHGFRVQGFTADRAHGRGYYLLSR